MLLLLNYYYYYYYYIIIIIIIIIIITTHSRYFSSFHYHQAPVVQTLDSTIHWINHYPADKHYGNQLRYPRDTDLSCG